MASAPTVPPWRSLLLDASCLVCLLLACGSLLQGLEQALDLGMWDEAGYLRSGLMLSWQALPDPEWGPLYSLWYFALSRVWPEPIALFYANHKLLLCLTVVGAYVLMRRMGARALLALMGASLYLLSAAPHTLPRPMLLALLVLLVVLIAASFIASGEGFWTLVAGGLLVAAFARPELFVAFLLATALLLLLLGRKLLREGRAALPRSVTLVMGLGLVTLGLMAALGNPFGNTSNRRFYAFCQHFAVNYVERTRLPVDPWGDCHQVIRSVFGEADTLRAALRNNPGEFLRHLGTNLPRYLGTSLRLFFEGPGGVSALRGAWSLERLGRLLLLAAVLWQLARLVHRRGQLAATMADPRLQRAGGVLLLVALPTFLSSVLIYPRDHYLVLQGVLATAFLATLGSHLETWQEPRPAPWRPTVALALGVVVLTPGFPRPSAAAGAGSPPVPLEHLHVVRAIQALGLTERLPPGEPIDLLEAQGGYDTYLGSRYRRVSHGDKREPFSAFIRKHGVELIVLDDLLRQDRRFVADAQFRAFQEDPAAFGFSVTPLPATTKALAFRDPSLPARGSEPGPGASPQALIGGPKGSAPGP